MCRSLRLMRPAGCPPNRNQKHDKDLCLDRRVTSGSKNAALALNMRIASLCFCQAQRLVCLHTKQQDGRSFRPTQG